MVRVAIPLIAAIVLGSPAITGSASAEQMVKGRGARERGSDGGSGATARGGGERRGDSGGQRTAERRDGSDRGRDNDDGQRRAVPRDGDRDRNNGPRVTVQRA